MHEILRICTSLGVVTCLEVCYRQIHAVNLIILVVGMHANSILKPLNMIHDQWFIPLCHSGHTIWYWDAGVPLLFEVLIIFSVNK